LTLGAARGARAWIGLAALLASAALCGWLVPRTALDWQPSLAAEQPWRLLSAAAVHYSGLHLAANLAGTAVVAALGWAASLPPRAVLAWAIAWPLTHLGLLLKPDLLHYGGLSGVLHAGVAVAALGLVAAGRGTRRFVGIAVAFGLVVKLSIENPLGPALQHRAGWDIAIAPFAHLSGSVAGALCAAVVLAGSALSRTHD
jgi:rhomboid family GlyGly-CTERM serine protease